MSHDEHKEADIGSARSRVAAVNTMKEETSARIPKRRVGSRSQRNLTIESWRGGALRSSKSYTITLASRTRARVITRAN